MSERTLSRQEVRKLYDRIGSRQDSQAFYEDRATDLIPQVAEMLINYGYPSQIIAAAIRHGRQIADAAEAGAHCVTAGLAVYKDSFKNPYTNMGERIFQDAWDATPPSNQ